MIDADERALLSQTVREAVAHAPADGVDEVLADLGWLDLLEAEPSDAIDIVFSALGGTNATATALDDVLVAALGIQPHRHRAVLLPAFGQWSPPGRTDGELVGAAGLASARVRTADELVVVCGAESGAHLVMVPGQHFDAAAVRGVDPDAGLHNVHVEAPGLASTPVDDDVWEALVAAGRRAIASQISGATRTMLGLACTHALERVQFGRPIARFQAVRHRLAEALVAIEALDATIGAAADEPGPITAALAKATAGNAARTVATQCQQVLAGIGFTTDHPFHRYLKRTLLLDGLFGTADDVTLEIGRQLLSTRTVPTLIEL